jgi:hypothetical protein
MCLKFKNELLLNLCNLMNAKINKILILKRNSKTFLYFTTLQKKKCLYAFHIDFIVALARQYFPWQDAIRCQIPVKKN